MKKEFIPYNLALLMKELGYAEPSAFYWADEIITVGFPVSDYLGSRWVAALLYQQCFRWFREKYNLHISIGHYCSQHDSKWGYNWNISNSNTDVHYSSEPDAPYGEWVFETYEEAEQACLEKLIEIVKNGEKN